MRRILVAGNWKMHGSQAMVEELLEGLLAGVDNGTKVDMAVFPPYPFLAQTRSMLKNSPIAWGWPKPEPRSAGSAHGGGFSFNAA